MREHVTQFKELPQLPFLQCALGNFTTDIKYILHRAVDQEVWFVHIWSIFASQVKFSEMLSTLLTIASYVYSFYLFIYSNEQAACSCHYLKL